ncbi:GNAT family N-acetyltransferase [Streptococcus fryi]
MFIVKSFQDLSTSEFFEIAKKRVAVFVLEQNCPYQEIDDLDPISLHIFKTDESGKILAYCRLIPTEETIKLGRVLVSKEYRQTGLGRALVSQALATCKNKFPDKTIFAQAQTYLQDFYSSFGFKSISEPYLEDNIPHIDMLLD